MKLLVIDEHEVARAGVKAMLKGEISDAAPADALKAIRKFKPDVVLLGMNLGGFEVLEAIKKEMPHLPVVAFSSTDDRQFVARTVRLGVADYLLKTAKSSEIAKALQRVAKGEDPDNPLMEVSRRRKESGSESDSPITARETEVLIFLSGGKSNGEIGKKLGISVETVKEHVQHLLAKLQVGDRTEAAVWAVRQGLV
jgi:DNA-binding NarL/FixJ family response regulator